MADIRRLNAEIESSVGEISAVAGNVEENVRRAVTSLQFQDLATQLLKHIERQVSSMGAMVDTHCDISVDLDDGAADSRSECRQRLQGFHDAIERASEVVRNAKHSPVAQSRMESGEVELF